MSLLLITKRGTGKKLVDEDIDYNWAGDKFKEFQEKTKEHIFFKKRKLPPSPAHARKGG